MATIQIFAETAQVLKSIIEAMQANEFEFGQLTLTDQRGTPVDLVFQNEKEVEHE